MVAIPTETTVTETIAPEVATPVVETKKKKGKKNAEAVTVPTTPAEGAVVEAAKPKGEHGMVRSKDVPWSKRKVAVLSTLKALGATGLTSAKSAKQVVEAAHAAGYTEIVSRDVRHYVYHGAAGGLTAIADKLPEGTPGGGYGFYLTQLGVDQDYPAILAGLNAPKAAAAAVTVPVVETPAS